jgi:hypothetical protein
VTLRSPQERQPSKPFRRPIATPIVPGMSTSMQSSAPLSNHSSPESGHLDSTSSHDSSEQKSGAIYQVKTLAARFGFFSPDSLKTVSTFINVVPTEVVCMFSLQLACEMNSFFPRLPCYKYVPLVCSASHWESMTVLSP